MAVWLTGCSYTDQRPTPATVVWAEQYCLRTEGWECFAGPVAEWELVTSAEAGDACYVGVRALGYEFVGGGIEDGVV